MNWFKNLKIKAKLLVAFGAIITLSAIAIVGVFQSNKAVERNFALAQTLTALEGNLNEQRATLLTMMAETDRAARESLRQNIEIVAEQNENLHQRVEDLTGDEIEQRAKIDAIAVVWNDFKQTRDGQVIPLIMEGKIDEVKVLIFGIQHDRFLKLRDFERGLVAEALHEAKQKAGQSVITFMVVGLVTLGVSIALALFLSRIIAVPLKQMALTAERIATGDLDGDVSSLMGNDEVGAMARSFGRMTVALRSMANMAGKIAVGDLSMKIQPQSDKDVLGHAFASMLTNLQSLTSDLQEGANVLGAATTEISSSTSQFAASAEESAAAVSETTTTVEEVRQTAQAASQKARVVSDSAQKAAQISETSRKATKDSIEGVNRIRQQMELIAGSMVRLSEQSQAIERIVSTVENLAAQSNLLAVNAAIEAAKAGEQGKGFAVVAQEVKSLAEQSKQATSQVRTVLTDIQQATSAAVMASEQGSKAVEEGVQRSAEADQSIETLSRTVQDAARVATQIEASNRQQLVGVDQVASAMEDIKRTSALNVNSARELDTAANNLKDLGQKLKKLTAAYRL